MIHQQIHEAANAVLAKYPDQDAMELVFYGYSKQIQEYAAPLIKRQRLMFQHNDNRFLPWCTVRPDDGK
ncbi:MAG: hypothetical protein OIF55_16830 [Amphritea sp.]|nr:hypothetical protein [Amphritea sp.]